MPAVLLLLQVIAVPFGYKLDIVILSKQLLGIINAVFGVLVILGIIADPTTTGITDKGAK
ncbi:hypothetical protein FC07_GL000575 [Loigolactobacillus bifermentans DSM 20003]|uniref:Holin n=1 Tax=Loigolactobacillus bifermentans DSM 20003 TaxID=1423726 RepID=A0A0R1GK26_9LACO|nr:hypothetical protein FC07_GL000575 [Loigolactobacillus bifermentans DSM 20003]